MDFIFDPSLVLYLPLYEQDGASFMSKDAYGHLCTVTGAQLTPSGRYFDGVDDKVDAGADPALDVYPKVTAGGWVLPMPSPGIGDLVGKAQDYKGYGLQVGYTGIFLRLGYQGVWYSSPIITATSRFQFAIGVYDGSYIRLYVDGVEITPATAHTSGFTKASSSTTVKIGCHYSGSGYFVNARIGEVFIFSRALSSPEIQGIYLSTKWRYR